MVRGTLAAVGLIIASSSAFAQCPAGTSPPVAGNTVEACEVGTIRFFSANATCPYKFTIAESGNNYAITDPTQIGQISAASDGAMRAVVSKGQFSGCGNGTFFQVVAIRSAN